MSALTVEFAGEREWTFVMGGRDLPAPLAEAELARLALDWRVRPVPVGSDRLWEAA